MKKNLAILVLSWIISPYTVILEAAKYLGMGIIWGIVGVCMIGLVMTRLLKDIMFFVIEKICVYVGNSLIYSKASASIILYAIAFGATKFNTWFNKVM